MAAQAATGTWKGPAPKGSLPLGQRGQRVAEAAQAPRPLPGDIRLGSARLPTVILDGRGASIESMAAALRAGVAAVMLQCSESAESAGRCLKQAASDAGADLESVVALVQVRSDGAIMASSCARVLHGYCDAVACCACGILTSRASCTRSILGALHT